MTYGPFFEHIIVATHRDVTVGVDNPTMDIVGVYVYVSELRTKYKWAIGASLLIFNRHGNKYVSTPVMEVTSGKSYSMGTTSKVTDGKQDARRSVGDIITLCGDGHSSDAPSMSQRTYSLKKIVPTHETSYYP